MIDLTGEKFGRWTVLSFSHKEIISKTHVYYFWNCRCECGTEKTILANTLRSGKSKNCGCLAKELSHKARKHGMSNTRLFSIWHSMIERCENPNTKGYRLYGARGISVCKEWHDSTTFFQWALSNGYADHLTIDRKDSNGNYEPTNCRWVDTKTQANNTSRNHYLTINGETKTVAQWGETNHIPYKLIYKRVNDLGWTFEKSVTTPVRKKGNK